LSDERTVKRDDAEAKYARVVGSGLLLFNRILGIVVPHCSLHLIRHLNLTFEQVTQNTSIFKRISRKSKFCLAVKIYGVSATMRIHLFADPCIFFCEPRCPENLDGWIGSYSAQPSWGNPYPSHSSAQLPNYLRPFFS
jgi:hypothetical protein